VQQACAAAASAGRLETVRFLRQLGLPWNADTICSSAARSGNIELLQYLKQQGCVFSERVMSTAAWRGRLHICQYLRAEQCPWDTKACESATRAGHLSTLRWLHEQGCPWDLQALRVSAAGRDCLAVLQYVLGAEPAATAAQLTQMLSTAGVCNRLSVAKALRQGGAEWPAVLMYNGQRWHAVMVQWARDEGCTSPL
jgi:hypothetical protein